jgi:hypothetical protein
VPVGLSVKEHLEREVGRSWYTQVGGRLASEREALHEELLGISPARFSAERSSLDVARYRAGCHQEHVLFLASDTDEGRLAAKLNATALSPTFSCVSDDDRTAFSHGHVTVIGVRALDPCNGRGFEQGMANIASLMGRLGRCAAPDDVVVVHLSGGFKVTLPHMVVLTEIMRSKRGACGTQALLLWEGTTGGSLTVPLRDVDPGRLKDELAGTLNGRCPLYGKGFLYEDSSPSKKTLLGKAIEQMLGQLDDR